MRTVCWWARAKAGRSRSKATRCIRRASARPTSSRRRPSSSCGIPTVRKASGKGSMTRSIPARRRAAASTWPAFAAAWRERERELLRDGGARMRVLTSTFTSPSLHKQLDRLHQRFPGIRWHRHDPLEPRAEREGARLAFGRPVQTLWHLDRARFVLALDADPFSHGPGSVRAARDWAGHDAPLPAAARRPLDGGRDDAGPVRRARRRAPGAVTRGDRGGACPDSRAALRRPAFGRAEDGGVGGCRPLRAARRRAPQAHRRRQPGRSPARACLRAATRSSTS